MSRIRGALRREPVLVIAAACAAASMAAVPPDAGYAGYVDWRVLGLLLALMAAVQGLRTCGALPALARGALRRTGSFRSLSLTLVCLPFFTSMLLTNDVALLTFVPFTVLTLELAGRRDALIRTVVLQTAAANLGSMATPAGNPQNLYLCAAYGLSPGAFFAAVLPTAGVSLIGLCAAALWAGGPVAPVRFSAGERVPPGPAAVYGGVFALCLLAVFRAVPWPAALAAALAALALTAPAALAKLDYGLLATFVCFFVFAGNLGRMDGVRAALTALLDRDTLLCAAGASQIISNVPAAVLLSGFTDRWRELLLGVDIGGLGTPVASLASLISLRLYLRTEGARPGRYLAVFTAVNLLGLAVLLAAAELGAV